MGRHDLKNETQSEENPARPPGSLGEEISGLPNSDEGIGRRACSAEIRGEPGTLSTLKENGRDQDHAVEQKDCQ